MKEAQPERPSCGGSERTRNIDVLVRVRSIRLLILLGFIFCGFRPSQASDAAGIQNEKNPESRYYIPPPKKQTEYDARPIGDPSAAERELENLNNSVSNAMQLAAHTRRAEEASGSLFKSVVIAAVILGGGIFIFRRIAPAVGSLMQKRFGIGLPEADVAEAANANEEKNFSEFVAAFKVGPKPGARRADVAVSSSPRDLSLDLEEKPSTPVDPLRLFYDSTSKTVSALRNLLPEVNRTSEEVARQKLLLDLFEKVQELKAAAVLPEVLPVWQMSAALEGLVKQLIEKNRNVTPSTLRTVASAVDLLSSLSAPGVKPDVVSNPPIRLLAVDDDSISRHAVSLALRKGLNKPDLAENGEAALALAAQIPYDVIFLDVQMPGMNGYETCSKIHATEVNRTTPVVFVTCQSDFDARAKSTLSGGNDLIGKPFLIFEITVKALTLAFRGRLQRRFGATAAPVAKPVAETLTTPATTQNEQAKAEKANGSPVAETKPSESPESATAPKHKSREERRRERRRRAQAARNHKDKGRQSRDGESDSRVTDNGSGSNQSAEQDSSLAKDGSTETSDSPLELSSDAIANAFLTQAPRHIRDLRNHFEQIGQATAEEMRQEMIVNLYLAAHSLAAEADLAKLDSILETASELEGLLKTMVEDPKSASSSTLEKAGSALKSLDELCTEEVAVTAK